MSPLSLQYRLNKRLITGIAAILLIFVATLGVLIVHDQSLEFDRSLESKARAVLDLTQRRVANIGPTDGSLVELEDGRSRTYVAIRRVDAPAGGAPTEIPDVTDSPRFTNTTLPDGTAGRQITVAFRPRAAGTDETMSSGIAAVIVAAPRFPLLWKAAKTSLILLGSTALVLLALAALVRHALRRGLEPVVGLRRQMETLDRAHRGQRVNLQAPPEELAPILRHINDLLERSEVAVAEQTVTR